MPLQLALCNMGALVAAVNKAGENVVPTVVAMLQELKHRGNDCHGVATPNWAIYAKKFEELNVNSLDSSFALGYNLSCILPRDQPQPVRGDGFTVVFEGRLFPSPNLPDLSEVNEIVGILGSKPLRNASSIVEKLEGSYVFAVADSNRVIVGRDVLGVSRLSYSENRIL